MPRPISEASGPGAAFSATRPGRRSASALFAANDPESSAAALSRIGAGFPEASRRWVGLLSLREDRGDRTLQWVRAAGEGFFRDFALVVLLGPPAGAALRKIREIAVPGRHGFFR